MNEEQKKRMEELAIKYAHECNTDHAGEHGYISGYQAATEEAEKRYKPLVEICSEITEKPCYHGEYCGDEKIECVLCQLREALEKIKGEK